MNEDAERQHGEGPSRRKVSGVVLGKPADPKLGPGRVAG